MANIRNIVSRTSFKKLQQEFGGRRVWIPKEGRLGIRDREYYQKRNDQIRKMKRAGFSVENIAARFGLSEKRVYNILNYAIDENW